MGCTIKMEGYTDSSCWYECFRLLRLLDQRYKGIAHGVGQSEIVGRIHVAPIKVL